MSSDKNFRSGVIFALLAYFCWGFFPIYWKFLAHVPFMQILSHRVIWAFIFYTGVQFYRQRKFYIYRPRNKKSFLMLSLASILLMGNWLVYIYAVNSNQIVESSLGYFINPLVNVLIGVVVLKEKLTKHQLLAVIFAVIGVLIISLDQEGVPVIALFLAISFSCYGLIKKLIPISSLQSNQFESFLMLPIALIYLLTQSHDWVTKQNVYWSALLLMGAGIVTGLPLLFFAKATQKIPYYLMGFFQFLAPTLQFLSGVILFNEPLSPLKLKGFVFIWVAGMVLITTNNQLFSKFLKLNQTK